MTDFLTGAYELRWVIGAPVAAFYLVWGLAAYAERRRTR